MTTTHKIPSLVVDHAAQAGAEGDLPLVAQHAGLLGDGGDNVGAHLLLQVAQLRAGEEDADYVLLEVVAVPGPLVRPEDVRVGLQQLTKDLRRKVMSCSRSRIVSTYCPGF